MKQTKIFNTICIAGMLLALFASVTPADAQQGREERWEFTLGTLYQFSNDLDFDGGSTVATQDDWGFVMTGGFHFTDKVEANFGFNWTGIGYDSEVIQEDGTSTGIRGTYDTFALNGNLIYHLMDGPFTPYVGAGIGWTWIDTNVPSGLPSTGCWWDPWWGYICYTSYPTHTSNAFSYQATVGLRYEFDNDMTFMKLGWVSQWMDLGKASGTPRFDVINLEIGWMF